MSNYEYWDQMNQDIECSSISELKQANTKELDNDSLLLVSVPGYETETGYMSKYLRLEDLVNKIREDMHLTKGEYWIINPAGLKCIHIVDGVPESNADGYDSLSNLVMDQTIFNEFKQWRAEKHKTT